MVWKSGANQRGKVIFVVALVLSNKFTLFLNFHQYTITTLTNIYTQIKLNHAIAIMYGYSFQNKLFRLIF